MALSASEQRKAFGLRSPARKAQKRKLVIERGIDLRRTLEDLPARRGEAAVLVPRHITRAGGEVLGKRLRQRLELRDRPGAGIDAGLLLKGIRVIVHAPEQTEARVDTQRNAGEHQHMPREHRRGGVR